MFNVPKGRGESTSAEDQLKKVMRDKLKIPEEDIEQIRFERVHNISHTTVSLWIQETTETKAKAVTAQQHINS